MDQKREGSILDVIYEPDTLDSVDGDDDVDMVDADTIADIVADTIADIVADEAAGAECGGESQHVNENRNSIKNKKKKRKKKNKRKTPNNITDVNRFVMDTCRRLKEKKSYLVWNAVGCLGVSAVSDLVKEVDVIQGCGGQKTADGKRFRNGGGILWNILKTREPKAYKEIMTKGREFEKQLWQPKKKQMTNKNENAASWDSSNLSDEATGGEVLLDSDHKPELPHGLEPPSDFKERVPVRDRIRVPVSYDDLFEEGEIHE